MLQNLTPRNDHNTSQENLMHGDEMQLTEDRGNLLENSGI